MEKMVKLGGRLMLTLQRSLVSMVLFMGISSMAWAQGLPPVPVPSANAITPSKAVLGKILFWDEQMSSDNRMACGTCHRTEFGGGDSRFGVNPGVDNTFGTFDDVVGSVGVRRADSNNSFMPDPNFFLFPQVTGRLAPTMINAAYVPEMFWDGRAGTVFDDPETGGNVLISGGALENQAAGPPLANAEMAHDNRNWSEITAKLATVIPLKLATNIPNDMMTALSTNPDYPSLFQAAFGSPQITASRIAQAIATYERTLISDQTPFDAFLAGNMNALTPGQQAGLQTFRTNGRCDNCHAGALTTDNSFRTIGIRPPSEDPGRMNVTGNAADLGAFKVPTLRNIGLRANFMHNGRFFSLPQVLAFYARGGDFVLNQDPIIAQINLPLNQRANLIDFLVNGLTDPRVAQAQFPFDRPTLNSEVNPFGSTLLGTDLAGTGGIAPIMLAFDPVNIGNTDYRLGVTTTLGASTAYLLYSDVPAAPNTVLGGVPFVVDPNHGSFGYVEVSTAGGMLPGDGYATLHFPIPNNPALIGFSRYVQWLVLDNGSAASLSFSSSRGAELVVF